MIQVHKNNHIIKCYYSKRHCVINPPQTLLLIPATHLSYVLAISEALLESLRSVSPGAVRMLRLLLWALSEDRVLMASGSHHTQRPRAGRVRIPTTESGQQQRHSRESPSSASPRGEVPGLRGAAV